MKQITILFTKYFDVIETFCTVGFAVALMVKTRFIEHWHYASYALWIFLGLLAFLYWVMGLKRAEKQENNIDLFLRKSLWMSLCVAVIGILLKVQFEDSAKNALTVGVIGILISVGLLIFKSVKEKSVNELKKHILRTGIVLSIATYLLILS